jgi:hypothetical protein
MIDSKYAQINGSKVNVTMPGGVFPNTDCTGYLGLAEPGLTLGTEAFVAARYLALEGQATKWFGLEPELAAQPGDVRHRQCRLHPKVVAPLDVVEQALYRKRKELGIFYLGAQRLQADAAVRVRQIEPAVNLPDLKQLKVLPRLW